MNRRAWVRQTCAGLVASSLFGRQSSDAQNAPYSSPYRLKFRHARADLDVGFNRHPWSSVHEESDLPARDWYSPGQERKLGAWGPHARQYPPAPDLAHRSAAWMQDRVIFAASRWIGYAYQHHHIPDWDPPASWPWHKVAYGRNSKGVDCSNFSSFCYNYALGVKLDTGIRRQAERREVRGPGGHGILAVEAIERAPYHELLTKLQPADLLYIRNDQGRIAHVIMWLGIVGGGPDSVPLILDSTGAGHHDANGIPIPIGVHIRPYQRGGWYAKDFSHAHRIVPGIHNTRRGEVSEAEEGGALDP